MRLGTAPRRCPTARPHGPLSLPKKCPSGGGAALHRPKGAHCSAVTPTSLSLTPCPLSSSFPPPPGARGVPPGLRVPWPQCQGPPGTPSTPRSVPQQPPAPVVHPRDSPGTSGDGLRIMKASDSPAFTGCCVALICRTGTGICRGERARWSLALLQDGATPRSPPAPRWLWEHPGSVHRWFPDLWDPHGALQLPPEPCPPCLSPPCTRKRSSRCCAGRPGR